jgi:cytochrome c553
MNAFAFRKTRWALAILAGAVTVFLATSSLPRAFVRAEDGDDEGEESRIRRGFAIAPLPLDPTGRNRALVGLGSYYVNAVASCADCHTNFPQYAPGGNPFLGQPKEINLANYLRGGRPFPAADPTHVENPIVSRSLLPENGLPAGLTLDQFVDVMRNGTDYDHPGRLLQVMGWPIFQNMTDRDLVAIYTYLSALPPP